MNKACVGSVVVSKQEGFRLFGANLTSPLPLLPLARFLLVCSEIFCRVLSGRGGGSGGVWGTISPDVGQTSTVGSAPRGAKHQKCALLVEKTRICTPKKLLGDFIKL